MFDIHPCRSKSFFSFNKFIPASEILEFRYNAAVSASSSIHASLTNLSLMILIDIHPIVSLLQ